MSEFIMAVMLFLTASLAFQNLRLTFYTDINPNLAVALFRLNLVLDLWHLQLLLCIRMVLLDLRGSLFYGRTAE